MKNRLLFCALMGILTACQQETDIQPGTSTLAGEAAGTYQTNFYLDPSYVAMSADQLPYAELKTESDNSVTLVYTKLYPTKVSQIVQHISLVRQSAGIQLFMDGLNIGTLQTDRIFTNSGMERQGQLLRLNLQSESRNDLNFVGSK